MEYTHCHLQHHPLIDCFSHYNASEIALQTPEDTLTQSCIQDAVETVAGNAQ